jgi:FtsH-binding integral membrane protein
MLYYTVINIVEKKMRKESTQSYQRVANLIDVGLRKYMLSVFSYMSAGLAVTAFISYIVSMSTAFMVFLFSAPLLKWSIILAPIGIVMYLSAKISSISINTAKVLFFLYASLLGVSLSAIFLVYSGMSIAYTFFVTSSMFLAMVVYGYTTGKDLTGFGSFLFMGLIGLIIAGVVNIFMQSHITSLVISAIGVIIFTGLTAYDVQVIKSYYLDSDSNDINEKKAIIGAMKLYMDFINLFLHLLRFLGNREH